MKDLILDSSVVLKWYLPDEQGVNQAISLLSEFIDGNLRLHAPSLIDYEFVNAMWVAGRMGRINLEDRDAAFKNFINFEIIKVDIREISESLLRLATKHNRSCYDASYLALSELLKVSFVTGDKNLFNAVKSEIASIVWIEDI